MHTVILADGAIATHRVPVKSVRAAVKLIEQLRVENGITNAEFYFDFYVYWSEKDATKKTRTLSW